RNPCACDAGASRGVPARSVDVGRQCRVVAVLEGAGEEPLGGPAPGELRDGVAGEPVDPNGLRARHRLAADEPAADDGLEGEQRRRRVSPALPVVQPEEALVLHDVAALLADLAHGPRRDALADVRPATGQAPAPVAELA